MEKTTVYLTAAQKSELAQAAEAQGRSEARLIRDGIDGVLARHRARAAAAPFGQEDADLPSSDALARRSRWITREGFVQSILPAQADPALGAALRDLAPDLTDEVSER